MNKKIDYVIGELGKIYRPYEYRAKMCEWMCEFIANLEDEKTNFLIKKIDQITIEDNDYGIEDNSSYLQTTIFGKNGKTIHIIIVAEKPDLFEIWLEEDDGPFLNNLNLWESLHEVNLLLYEDQ